VVAATVPELHHDPVPFRNQGSLNVYAGTGGADGRASRLKRGALLVGADYLEGLA